MNKDLSMLYITCYSGMEIPQSSTSQICAFVDP